MSEMVERATEALIAKWRIHAGPGDQPDVPFWRDMARAAIEAMRELPGEPGPRYTAGEYSRRTQEAMIDDALGKVDA